MRKAIVPLRDRLHFLPACGQLVASEADLQRRISRETVLHRALQQVRGDYDLVIIDTPPTRNLLSLNALASADEVVVPSITQAVDLRGLQLFRETVEEVRALLNPRLRIVSVVATFFDPRLLEHRAGYEALQQADLPVAEATIGRSIRIAEAAAYRQTIEEFEPNNPQAHAYRALAAEIGLCHATATP